MSDHFFRLRIRVDPDEDQCGDATVKSINSVLKEVFDRQNATMEDKDDLDYTGMFEVRWDEWPFDGPDKLDVVPIKIARAIWGAAHRHVPVEIWLHDLTFGTHDFCDPAEWYTPPWQT